MKERFERMLSWTKRNERHISTGVFVFGFLSDIATYVLIPVSVANMLFVLYLALAALGTLGSHALFNRVQASSHGFLRTLQVLFPLGAQYFLGGLLSGFLIFYTKSAVVLTSWPFLLLLLFIFLGNEVFRDYRAHLAFQTVLFFFALYAYLIFALPLFVHAIGPTIFLESTVLASGIFAAFLLLIALAGWKRFRETFRLILLGSVGIVLVVVGAYFTNVIPPIPLTLQEGVVAHLVTHAGDTYQVQVEAQPAWWKFWQPTIVHHVPGTGLYAFSSVFAPVAFSSGVVHEWQYYNPAQKKWVTEATIAFTISGGRRGGYRGYSEKDNPMSGRWRVFVETTNRQVIGRIDFEVENVAQLPALISESK